MSFIENMGLRIEGFSDEQIAQIEAAKPELLHIIADIQVIWPRVQVVLPHIQAMLPHAQMILPHVDPTIIALVERVAKTLPLFRMVLEVVNRKE
jgi:hypothetical protein